MADEAHVSDALQPLLDRLAAGDETAVDLLIEHWNEPLQRLAQAMLARDNRLKRWYQGCDVAQAAAMRLRRALKKVKPRTQKHFERLAAKQIKRALCDLARREFGRRGYAARYLSGVLGPKPDTSSHQQGLEAKASDPTASKQVGWKEWFEHFRESLPQKEREVFDLCEVQGLPEKEVAQRIGKSIPTVRRRLRQARLHLADALRSDDLMVASIKCPSEEERPVLPSQEVASGAARSFTSALSPEDETPSAGPNSGKP